MGGSLLPLLTNLSALALFGIVVADIQADFSLLGAEAAWVLVAAGAALLVAARLVSGLSHRNAVSLLLLGALVALSIRTLGYGSVLARSSEQWEALQERSGERIASRVTERFAALSQSARSAARRHARASPLAVAVEGSDAQDYLSGAFEVLERASLPRAHEKGVPGATLYDASLRPLAWSGENVSLDEVFEEMTEPLESDIFILERGVYTYLVAIEPLLSRLGLVSVEIPLAVDRRLENRYLEDYDAISSWVGRRLDTDYISLGEETRELTRLFETFGEPFWGGTDEAPRLYFGLRTGDGTLLGVSSVAGEIPPLARLEARRRFQLASAVSLVVSALIALCLLWRGGARLAVLVGALWGLRFILLYTNFPLGLWLDLDNPAHYASSLLFGLARSPTDLLLTMAAVLGTALAVAKHLHPWESLGRRESRFKTNALSLLAAAVVLSLNVGANQMVRDAWSNSNVSLSAVSLLPPEAPRLVVQLSLVGLFVSTVLAGFLVFSLAERRRAPSAKTFLRAALLDGLVVLAGYAVLKRVGLGDHVVLSALPLFATHWVALGRSHLTRRWVHSGLYFRLMTSVLVLLLAVLSFYPSLVRFEEATIRNFIETNVTPLVLQHEKSRVFVIAETARAIDRMLEEGRLHELDREDLAYQIWVNTDLAVSSLSSSLEIIDGNRELVSRFALSFPAVDLDIDREPAPREWIGDEKSLPSDPQHPGFLVARRSLPGPDGALWEIRVRVAADWRNLPFIATSNPYLDLFRTSSVDTPLRFPYQELELFVLEPDGSAVFQSAGGSLRPGEEVLGAARRAPLWWHHEHEGEVHRTYLFGDEAHVYALSYPQKPVLTYAAELAGWALFTAVIGGAALLVALFLGILGSPLGVSPRELWAPLGTSFYGKLYVAFVLIALVPIVSLAFVIRGIVIQQLERDVEEEGIARAGVVERFVDDLLVSERQTISEDATTMLTDAVLEWVGSLASVDVDLYSRGELLATSTPELFHSGLLRTRAVPSAHREIVLERLSHSIHRESVGSFEYLVVSVPITLARWIEPGILSLPLASRQPEIARKVSSLNQMLLLAALGFSLAAAALAHSLARRIAGPINTLTDATHRVAEGDLEVSVRTQSKDEIGTLFASFRQMIADLKRQRQDLEQTKKLEAWAEMARQVAHEVKNPLTPIQLSTEHLLRVYRDPNVDFERVLEDCSETILQQVKTLRQISMEFSTFASPDSLKLEPTDIEELVQKTVEPYLSTPPDGVSFRLAIEGDLPPLRADSRLLKRTLVNIVENALLAVNGKGEVSVRVEPHRFNGRRFVEVSVTDTGAGIDPELRDRIFEPYFSTRAAGTGLGLAIAKKVVEDHGGSISLESDPGNGTRVTIRLPAAGE